MSLAKRMGNQTRKKLYRLKDEYLAWFEKLKEVLEARYFVQYQVGPCVRYKEEMVVIFMLMTA